MNVAIPGGFWKSPKVLSTNRNLFNCKLSPIYSSVDMQTNCLLKFINHKCKLLFSIKAQNIILKVLVPSDYQFQILNLFNPFKRKKGIGRVLVDSQDLKPTAHMSKRSLEICTASCHLCKINSSFLIIISVKHCMSGTVTTLNCLESSH